MGSTFGPAYEKESDEKPLNDQRERIRRLMMDGLWRTLPFISELTGAPESSVSAQLRHLRKEEFGSYRVEKRRRKDSRLWEYQVLAPEKSGQLRFA